MDDSFQTCLGRYNVVEADTQLAVAGDTIVIMYGLGVLVMQNNDQSGEYPYTDQRDWPMVTIPMW